MMDEQNLYRTTGISVTAERVVVGDQVIPVASIVSASVGTATAVPPLVLGCTGAFLLLLVLVSGIGGCVALTEGSGAGPVLIVLAVVIAIMLFAAQKLGGKKRYFVIVNTAAGAAHSSPSRDEGAIRAAVEAVNNAVIARG